MIYTFRLEKSSAGVRLDDRRRRRQFCWEELIKGTLHQGWGRSGMSLLDASGDLVLKEDWVANFILTAKKVEWGDLSNRKALLRYRLLSRMCAIRPGDLIVVPNMSDRGHDGLVLARAIGRDGTSEPDALCYGWEGSRGKNHPLQDDHRHFVCIDPFRRKRVRYDLGQDGKHAKRLQQELRRFRNCVDKIEEQDNKNKKLISIIQALYDGKIGAGRSVEREAGGRRAGHPLSRAQLERGQQAEDEMLDRLDQGGFEGLRLVKDCRHESCGYDFLCRDARGIEIELEVKGFTRPGQLFLSERELRQAKSSGQKYWLVGFLVDGPRPQWRTQRLKNPAPQLEGIGRVETVQQLRVDESKIKWDR